MAAEVVLPRQGWTMEVGSIVEWRKRDGDAVKAGEVLFTLQSDKAVNEIEALDSGVLRIPSDSPPPGKEVPIGTLLAYIVAPGEPAPFEAAAAPAPQSAADPVGVAPDAAGGTGAPPRAALGGRTSATNADEAKVAVRRGGPAISPRARRVASQLGVAWAELRGSGATGRIVERDVRAALAEAPPPRVNPAARRRAQELGVDLDALARARPGKRIELADVEAAARPAAAPSAVAPSAGIRRLIAGRMAESAHTTAPVTLTTEADASELVRLREGAKAAGGSVPSYNDLLVRICALVLRGHPELNASWSDEGVVHHGSVHVGVAVETERGLLVPVVRDADKKSVGQIAAESAGLIERARAGRATAEELGGGTFTITNLGPYEIDAFTPIVNLPECAILGVGRIAAKPIVLDDGRIEARKMVALSLTFDHRIVDGAPAARFLQRIKHFVERPSLWLLT
ncbi:MAG TPA: dihydrolipoamide acetyltransferase family protein [Chloroflexota bacterium]|nr:dihydrolipoamide acetyltransferase family protein [Chloroflexota bacterium]